MGAALYRLEDYQATPQTLQGRPTPLSPGLLAAEVTACATWSGRLYVATRDGAVVGLVETGGNRVARVGPAFQFRLPGPPRPVIGLAAEKNGHLCAVTGEEHIYFFTRDGAPDERISVESSPTRR